MRGVQMKKQIVSLCVLFLLSVFVVSFSVFLGHTFDSYEEMHKGKFGFPIPFVYQDLIASGLGYEGGFPRNFGMQVDFLDNDPVIVFNKLQFLLSVIIVYCLFSIIYFIRQKIKRETRVK